MAALVIANPNINIYFHKIGFISVGKLSLNVKCPCSLECKFLGIAPCLRRCSFLSFLQQVDPPVPTRAACVGICRAGPCILKCFLLTICFSFCHITHCFYESDAIIVKTPLYLGQKLRKVLGNLMLLQIVNSAVATSMLQGKILFNGLLLS